MTIYGRKINDEEIKPTKPLIQESGFGSQNASTPNFYYQRAANALSDVQCLSCGRKWILNPGIFTTCCPSCGLGRMSHLPIHKIQKDHKNAQIP